MAFHSSSDRTTISIAIAAAGTGGHIFPALAIAKALQEKGVSIAWIGTPNGMEHRLLEQETSITLYSLSFSGVRGKGLRSWLWLPFRLWSAFRQANTLLHCLQPALVLGMGGYISFPVALATKWQKRTLVLHEQNQLPGTANRWLSRIADCILCGFPNTGLKAITVGNPVRHEFFALPAPTDRANERMKKNLPLKIVVMGGSLGAVAFNQQLPKALALWCMLEHTEKQHPCLEIVHQCGRNRERETVEAYESAKLDDRVQWQVCAFVDEPAKLLGSVDFLICRAGAQTVSEVAAAGVAALFVPFPYAVDDHQTHNAHYLTNIDAAWVIQQSALTDRVLADFIAKASRQALAQVGSKAQTMAKPEAAESAADHCLRLLHRANISSVTPEPSCET